MLFPSTTCSSPRAAYRKPLPPVVAAWIGEGRGTGLATWSLQLVEIAKYDALSTARKNFGTNVRLLASSGRSGYRAIATSGRINGPGGLIGIALGSRTRVRRGVC